MALDTIPTETETQREAAREAPRAALDAARIEEKVENLLARIDRFAEKFVILGGKVIPRSALGTAPDDIATESPVGDGVSKK